MNCVHKSWDTTRGRAFGPGYTHTAQVACSLSRPLSHARMLARSPAPLVLSPAPRYAPSALTAGHARGYCGESNAGGRQVCATARQHRQRLGAAVACAARETAVRRGRCEARYCGAPARGVAECRDAVPTAREEPLSRLLICPRQVTGAHTLGRDQHK